MAQPLVLVALVVAIGVVWIAVSMGQLTRVGAVWMTLGALSNIYDTVRLGGVVDYLPLGSHATNLSDLLIVAGCLICIVELARPITKRPSQ